MANSSIGLVFKWFVGFSVLLIFVVGGWFHLRLHQFRAMTQKLKEQGRPLSMLELQHTVDDSDSDALPLLLRAEPLLKTFSKELHQIDAGYLATEGFSCRPSEFAMISNEKMEKLRQLLDRHQELARLADEMFVADDITVKTTSVLNGSIKSGQDDLGWLAIEFVNLGQFALLRSRVMIANGDIKGAVSNGLATMRFGNLVSRRNDGWYSNSQAAFVASCGIQSVYEAISVQPVKASTYAEIIQVIESFDVVRNLTLAANAERASTIEHIVDRGIQHSAINGVPVLKYFTTVEERMSQELFEYDYERVDYSFWKHGPWLSNCGILYDDILLPEQVSQLSRLRALRLIVALLDNRVAPEEFEALDDKHARLVELGVPSEMTKDTCTGKLMKVRFVDGMWRVYSVGMDKIDDGGTFHLDPGLAWKSRPGATDP